MVAICIDSLRIGCAVGNSSSQKLATGHHLVKCAITRGNLQACTGTHLGISQLQTVLIVNPSVGGIDTHIQIGVDRLHEGRTGIVAPTLEVAEQSDTVRMGEVPRHRSRHVT